MPRPRRFCTEAGCDEPRVGRGWCRKHYSRWHATGNVSDPIRIDEDWPEGHKPCSACKAMLPLEDFTTAKKSRTGRASACKPCNRARLKAARDIGTMYGLRPGDYDAMFAEQGGVCGSCGREEMRCSRLVIDHDHATGKVRGLLCSECNLGLGKLGDDIDGVLACLVYLLRASERDDLSAKA